MKSLLIFSCIGAICGGGSTGVSALPADGAADCDTLSPGEIITLDAGGTIDALLAEEDTDGDLKISVRDRKEGSGRRGDGRFRFDDTSGSIHYLEGTYHLSVLLQELALQGEAEGIEVSISTDRIFENPVDRISRMIRERYWDSLTRRVDIENLEKVLPDDKIPNGRRWYLYISPRDTSALGYFHAADSKWIAGKILEVDTLPEDITPQYVRDLGGRHGLLPLALRPDGSDGGMTGVPYVVPGGRFNEMYGWDSYFEVLGLLRDGRADLARAMVDNFVYEIEYYGRILNGNRTYYLTRSQPPFLTSMALAVYSELERSQQSKQWLAAAMMAAIKEYRAVWTAPERMTETGLSRYYGAGIGRPPEVEEGHFDEVYRPFADRLGIPVDEFETRYTSGGLDISALDEFHSQDRAMRESGHDRSYRWFVDGPGTAGVAERDRCADFVTVDLNCLLHKYEIDIARTIRDEFGGELKTAGGNAEKSETWYALAERRRSRIMKYLWSDSLGLFIDWDFVRGAPRYYVTAAAFYPLWACHDDDPATYMVDPDEAPVLVANALRFLEERGGLAASARESLESVKGKREQRQWDYPFGWAPHQMMAWTGLKRYGFESEADRLIYRWLYMITSNAMDFNGTIPEKFDVVRMTHDVFAEYGNVGTDFDYITGEGFGWMNASYQLGLSLIGNDLLAKLKNLVPPDSLFERTRNQDAGYPD